MLAICEHCGHANEVAAEAANTEVRCQKCGELFSALSAAERAANRRASRILLAAVLIFFAVIAVLLLLPSRSSGLRAARVALFGSGLAGRLGGGGTGEGLGRGLAGAQATNVETSPDQLIGRLPQTLGARKAGDEIRAGAAGSDDADPNHRVGNSRTGQITNAPSAGANPGNSDIRNSVETPDGTDVAIGRGAGEGSPTSVTNAQPGALLLDDFSERLRQAGARSGDVQISLEWKNINDLDLHVIDPRGEEIFYNHRTSASGGMLDVDMNAARFSTRPVENVYWPERGAPAGVYRVAVVHFANHGAPDPTQFSVRIVNKGTPSYYRGYISYIANANRARVPVCSFTVQ
jgi:hypothetical protein